MYERLSVVSGWLERLGLAHRSNLGLMRQRLAGTQAEGSLDRVRTPQQERPQLLTHVRE